MKVLWLTIAAMLLVAPVMAADYSENFDSYAPGTLNSNAAWSSANENWTVVANSSLNGTNGITPAIALDLQAPRFSGVTFVDGTVASVDMVMGETVNPAEPSFFFWNIGKVLETIGGYPLTPFAGLNWENVGGNGYQLRVTKDNGDQWGGYGWTTVNGTMYAGDKYHLTATFNFTDQTVAYGINDITDPSRSLAFSAAFGIPATIASVETGGFYLGGRNITFDNLSVSTVPEPSALLALGSGLMGICGFSIRRRK